MPEGISSKTTEEVKEGVTICELFLADTAAHDDDDDDDIAAAFLGRTESTKNKNNVKKSETKNKGIPKTLRKKEEIKITTIITTKITAITILTRIQHTTA